jgi:hypothetical protein
MQPCANSDIPLAERQRRLVLALAAMTARRLYGIYDPHIAPITSEQIAAFLEICSPALTSYDWLAIYPSVLNYADLFPCDLKALRTRMAMIRPYAEPDLAGVDSEDALHIRRLVKALGLSPRGAESKTKDAP